MCMEKILKKKSRTDAIRHRKTLRRDRRVQIRLTNDLYDRLHTIAEGRYTSDSAILMEALLAYLQHAETDSSRK